MTIRLPEIVVPGKRLGRHILHDPRSLRFLLPDAADVVSVTWARNTPILDQGDLGSCTGNATVGALGSGPLYVGLTDKLAAGLALDETLAIAIYSAAEKLDGGAGYPPEDEGSSGLSVAKVAAADGYVNGYLHATTISAAHTAIQKGPFLFGTNWYSGMDNPSADGVVTATGTLRGGHEIFCREYDAAADLLWFDNSWGESYGVAGRFAMNTSTFATLLARSGDITSLVPVNAPAPVPTPVPVPTPAPGVDYEAAVTEFARALPAGWETARHVGANRAAAAATAALLTRVGLG